MKYTKEQLVKAQHKYNKKYAANPKDFADPTKERWNDIEVAENQIEFLLDLID